MQVFTGAARGQGARTDSAGMFRAIQNPNTRTAHTTAAARGTYTGFMPMPGKTMRIYSDTSTAAAGMPILWRIWNPFRNKIV